MKSVVYNMDCFEYMKTLEDNAFDLALCDSPYVDLNENTGTIRTSGNVQSKLELGGKPSDEVFQEIFRVSKHQIIWGANNFGYPFQGFVVWDKTNIPEKFTMSKCEIASLDKGLSRVSKIFRMSSFAAKGEKRLHPTQKPIELYEWLLMTYAQKGWKVLDPFLGSGSSRIACDKFGCDFVGCEINKEFYDKHCERWNNYKSQLSFDLL